MVFPSNNEVKDRIRQGYSTKWLKKTDLTLFSLTSIWTPQRIIDILSYKQFKNKPSIKVSAHEIQWYKNVICGEANNEIKFFP